MKKSILLTLLLWGAAAQGGAPPFPGGAVIGQGLNGVPFSPVNHTGQPIGVAVADENFYTQYWMYIPTDAQGQLEWIDYQPGWIMVVQSPSSGAEFTLDTSGTNANACQFVWNDEQVWVDVFQASGQPPVPGSTVGMSDLEFNWFKAGFGLALSFLGFGWCLRMAKNIGRASPDM